MVDTIYFSAQLQPNGEVKLIKHSGAVALNPAPVRVSVIISKPVPVSCADPTLTVFYEPKESRHDETH